MKPLNQCRILVTPTSYARNDPMLRTQLEQQVAEVIYNPTGRLLSSAELVTLISGIDGYIAGLDDIDHGVIDAADCLKVIARYGIGVDTVDLEAARKKCIIVTNTPGANSSSVAELAVGLMLCLARNIPGAAKATSCGQWPLLTGISLQGKVVGLLGFGSIGKQVARRLQGFDCTVLAYDPIVTASQAANYGVQLVSREDMIRRVDFLSLHCPLTNETKRMVNTDFIAQMKNGAYLINTARGELVDESGLLDALLRGKLRGAALDVFVKEPPNASDPLLALPQVIATPHMSSHTDSAMNAMGWEALKDCLSVLRGEEPAHRVV